MKKSLIVIALLFASTAYPHQEPAALINKIEQLRTQMHIPGASFAVLKNGHVIWKKSLGYADIQNKRKMTTNTLLQACSITKTLTSTAVLKILNDRKIFLDEPVNRYLKNWKIPTNQFTQKVPVTFRMLLNHTAAISNPYPPGGGGYGFDKPMPNLTQVFEAANPATNKAVTVTDVPGGHYQYCNGCYAVLQGVLEDITGKPYEKIISETVFESVNMPHSLFYQLNKVSSDQKNVFALPYDPNWQNYKTYRSPILATGGLWTTPSDLLEFANLITQSLKKDTSLLPKVQAWQLITPSSTPTRGLGFFISNRDVDEAADGAYIYHSGANIGYLSLLIISKDGENGAAFIINISPQWDAKNYPQFDFIKKSLHLIAEYYHWK